MANAICDHSTDHTCFAVPLGTRRTTRTRCPRWSTVAEFGQQRTLVSLVSQLSFTFAELWSLPLPPGFGTAESSLPGLVQLVMLVGLVVVVVSPTICNSRWEVFQH